MDDCSGVSLATEVTEMFAGGEVVQGARCDLEGVYFDYTSILVSEAHLGSEAQFSASR